MELHIYPTHKSINVSDGLQIVLDLTRLLPHSQVQGLEGVSAGHHQQVVRRFTVREDAAPSTVIGSASLAEQGRFRYSVSEGDGRFHFGVDGSSGELYVRQPLDYESAAHYFLTVLAEDGAADAPWGANVTVLVGVTVEDVNDHTPWFPDSLVALGLREDAAVGSLAFAFHARDADGTFANSALRYSLTFDPGPGGRPPSRPPFRIDPRTGRLSVAAPLDREATPTLAFTVTASDRAEREEERRRASVTARVVLLDVNDNRPVFTSAGAAQVMEDAELGSLLHHFVAADGDLGENGLVSYSIVAGNENGLFTLEEKTGEMNESNRHFADVEEFLSCYVFYLYVKYHFDCINSSMKYPSNIELQF